MNKRYLPLIVAMSVAGVIAGTLLARLLTRPAVPALESGTVYPQPRALADFALLDANGAAATPETLRGHPTLAFFGFTHCPDVCPTTLALLTSVQKQANVPGLKVALISVDPGRDSPEQMGRYIASFGGDLIGLTGSAPEIVRVTRAFGVAAARVDLPGGSYTMDHSATVFALDSQARIVAVFTPPLSAAAMTRDMGKLAPALEAGGGS